MRSSAVFTVIMSLIILTMSTHISFREIDNSSAEIFNEENNTSVSSLGTRSMGSTSIVITEMTGDQDFCEMVNVGVTPLTITGWKLHGYDEGSNYPNPDFTFTFPNTIVPAGGIFTVTENGGAPGTYPNFFTGANIMWVSGGGARDHGAILVDTQNKIIDMVICGDINPQVLQPVTPAPNDWVGQPVPPAQNNMAEYRTGDQDTNTNADWRNNMNPTKGTLAGSGMNIPFVYLPVVDSMRIIEPTLPDGTCFTRYSNYTLQVNVTSSGTIDDASELRVYLDYNTTNATLVYNWTNQVFYKSRDNGGHV